MAEDAKPTRLDRVVSVAFVVFSVGGLALLFSSDEKDRALGLVCVLFFGGGGTLVLLAHAWLPEQPRLQLGAVDLDGSQTAAILFEKHRSRDAARLVFTAAAFAGVALMGIRSEIFDSDDQVILRIIGVLATVIGAWVVGVQAFALIRGRKLAALTAQGILFVDWRRRFIPWDLILGCGVYRMGLPRGVTSEPMIGLRLRSEADRSRVEGVSRWSQLAGSTGWDVSLHPRAFEAKAYATSMIIEHFVNKESHRSRIGQVEELDCLASLPIATPSSAGIA